MYKMLGTAVSIMESASQVLADWYSIPSAGILYPVLSLRPLVH